MKYNKVCKLFSIVVAVYLLLLSGCNTPATVTDSSQKGATTQTVQKNKQVYDKLNFNDKDEVLLAEQCCMDNPEVIEVSDKDGNIIYSQKGYSFINDLTPSENEVNPALWNNTSLNCYYGLFCIDEDFLYQVRGYDVTNLTVIATDEGYIVINPMSNIECATAAMELIYRDIGIRPILATVFTTTSVDCWGGITALQTLNKENFGSYFEIIAPKGFDENVTEQYKLLSENHTQSLAYEQGMLLEKNAKGAVSVGNSLSVYSGGTVEYASPTKYITEETEKVNINSVELEFNLKTIANDTFMNVYIDNCDTLYIADNMGASLENLFDISSNKNYPANEWSQFLIDTLARYSRMGSVVQAHNWAHTGSECATNYIKNTAKAYKYLHDQTVKAINNGMSKSEIVKNVTLPDSLSSLWYLRQFSVTVEKCVESIYNDYVKTNVLDYNNIAPLSDREKADKLIEYMGNDTDLILTKVRQDFDKGEYKWVCEICSVLLEQNENNEQAKYLCADALEQLAYSSESGTDRNIYLTNAKRLRENIDTTAKMTAKDKSIRENMSVMQILDIMSIHLDEKKAKDENILVNIFITDENKSYVVEVQDGVMLYSQNSRENNADASIQMSKKQLLSFLSDDYSIDGITAYGNDEITDKLSKLIIKDK